MTVLCLAVDVIRAQGEPGQEVILHDNVEGSDVNLATFPVRPMAYDDSGNLWAINHHDSRVRRFVLGNPTVDRDFGVPWDPVSIAFVPAGGGTTSSEGEILVACRGTWAIVGVHPETGEILRVIQLRPSDTNPESNRMGRMAEPGDLVVDTVNHRAFVSCTGADSVIQIDLTTSQVVEIFHRSTFPNFLIKSPLFLSLREGTPDGEYDGHVFVTPLHSGNNTAADVNLASSRKVFSLATWTQGLPDDDLFEIIPEDGPVAASVKVHDLSLGTILFAQGVNPSSRQIWSLNTDHVNAGAQSEPGVQGVFAMNRVSYLDTELEGSEIQVPSMMIETTLDGIGQPYALTFDASGNGFITGLLTDNVVVLDAGRNLKLQWSAAGPLGQRAIPRGILVRLDGSDRIVEVHCWGDNVIRAYRVSGLDQGSLSATLETVYPLGHDPTPALVRHGRDLFFDGTNSESGDLSCATCHVEGGSDFLAWNLSNKPIESKGPMVTQTLVGLERLEPFHWRGERAFEDFNPAFESLLGGSELSASDLEAFEAFVFSLKNPANPYQNRTRVLDDTIHATTPLVGSASSGHALFFDPVAFTDGAHACVDCHMLPTGTINDFNVEQPSQDRPRRALFKAAPFHEIWRKEQPRVPVQDQGSAPVERALLGSGFGHTGGRADIVDFAQLVVGGSTDETELKQRRSDMADFLIQWDQGLAPAVHHAYQVDATILQGAQQLEIAQEELTYLYAEAVKHVCDVAVLSWLDPDGQGSAPLQSRRWFLDDQSWTFVCEDPSLAPRSLNDFLVIDAANKSHAFIGLPVGMAERWAVDFDLDGLRNLDPTESDPYDRAVPGATSPTPAFANGPTVAWSTARVARLHFETQSPTTAEVLVREVGASWPAVPNATSQLGRSHAVMLTGLRPSSYDFTSVGGPFTEDVEYEVRVDLLSADGQSFLQQSGITFSTKPSTHPSNYEDDAEVQPNVHEVAALQHVITKLCMVPDTQSTPCDELIDDPSVNGIRLKVEVQVEYRRGDRGTVPDLPLSLPAASRVVVGRVLVSRDGATKALDDPSVALTATGYAQTIGGAKTFQIIDVDPPITRVPLNGVPGSSTEKEGPFLVSAPTDSGGLTYVECVVGPEMNIQLDDRFVFVVDAVVEAAPGELPTVSDGVGEIGVPSARFGLTQWSFPNTKEANSFVISRPYP